MSLRLVQRLFAVLPETVVTRGGALAGLLVGGLLRIRRRAVDRHLQLAFPEASPRWRTRVARASYRHLGRESALLLKFASRPPKMLLNRVELTGVEALLHAVEEGTGALVLTGHVGNWEVAGAVLAARGVPLDIVVKGMASRSLERELFRARERLGVRLIPLDAAPRMALQALHEGRAVGIAGDQNAHKNGIFVPFFGRLAATHRGAALFALRSGVPVYITFALRAPGAEPRYRMKIEPLEVGRTGDLGRDVEAFLSAYMAAVESEVRASPEQYLWQHLRWKTRPEAVVGNRSV